jgi:hypothetical protein
LKAKYKVFYYINLSTKQGGGKTWDPEAYGFYWVAEKWYSKEHGVPCPDYDTLLAFILEWVIL